MVIFNNNNNIIYHYKSQPIPSLEFSNQAKKIPVVLPSCKPKKKDVLGL